MYNLFDASSFNSTFTYRTWLGVACIALIVKSNNSDFIRTMQLFTARNRMNFGM